MIKDCQDLVNAYIEWLRQKISVENINGVCEITTPFLDRHNDHLQIYVKKSDSGLILTDDGYTITDLQLSGCEFTTEKRRQMLHSILSGFGVRLVGDELIVEARQDNFPQKKHDLLQAILAVNDLFVMAAPMVASIFREDVERYLRMHQIRFTPSVKFTGKSGLDHSFDFVIPASQTKPERVLRAISSPNRQNISLLIFSWTEIAEVRASDSTACGVLNDTDQVINLDLISALKQYGIKVLPWTKRDEYVEELTG
ncbi:MAG: hypothetical protein COS84_11410 [Armatimonadetes bacterium CG07_land_8_20_14_0_80_40_9]|nr:MAG: hypothetical protein COS84_11410 [Armatimonadetes bacterium CG07_land_8_20_14_0_80_40_9]